MRNGLGGSIGGRAVCGLGAVLFLLAAGCDEAAGRSARRQLVITGSSTVAPLVAEIGKRFEATRPGVRVDVQSGGSSRGMADARLGLADIGMVSRALGPAESDLTGSTIALDGLCLIVHRDNPVTVLDDAQIVSIFTGDVRDWSAVGGSPGTITVVSKAEGRSTLELFLKHFHLQSSAIEASVVIGDNQHGLKVVAGDPAAIGYVSIGAAEYEAGQGSPIKLLPLDDVAARVEHIVDGTFPLARPLNLVTIAEPVGLAKEFIEFARSEEVHDIVRGLYLVPVEN